MKIIGKLFLAAAVSAVFAFAACDNGSSGGGDDASSVSMDYSSATVGTLKYVEGGSFQRDDTATNVSAVSSFRMGQHEVTRAEFLAVMGSDPSNVYASAGSEAPVQNLSWYMAIAFCNKASLLDGLTPVYAVTGIDDWAALAYADIPTAEDANWDAATATWTNNGYRLPTQMEWLWAAMGGAADALEGDIVAGVNVAGYLKAYAGSVEANSGYVNITDYACWGGMGYSYPACSFKPNELGIYDLSGNVEEWMWDLSSASWPTGALTDYRGSDANDSSSRAYLGGYYAYPLAYTVAISLNRAATTGSTTSGLRGFRVARN